MEGQYVWSSNINVLDGGSSWRKGPWTPQEDKLLIDHVNLHGDGRWNCVSRLTGMKRSGKSCRLRWVNYLRPDLKRGKISPHEETIIQELHARWGNRWSTIARSLPGRTDNEIKNYWRTHFKKKTKSTKNVERARARFLRQQQAQNQQRYQNHEEQQQQQQQFKEENDHIMTGMISQVEITEMAQEMQEMAYMFPLLSYNNMFQATSGSDVGATASEEASAEEMLETWESLWNLDDIMMQDGAFSLY